jgi:hypothetical protein
MIAVILLTLLGFPSRRFVWSARALRLNMVEADAKGLPLLGQQNFAAKPAVGYAWYHHYARMLCAWGYQQALFCASRVGICIHACIAWYT